MTTTKTGQLNATERTRINRQTKTNANRCSESRTTGKIRYDSTLLYGLSVRRQLTIDRADRCRQQAAAAATAEGCGGLDGDEEWRCADSETAVRRQAAIPLILRGFTSKRMLDDSPR